MGHGAPGQNGMTAPRRVGLGPGRVHEAVLIHNHSMADWSVWGMTHKKRTATSCLVL